MSRRKPAASSRPRSGGTALSRAAEVPTPLHTASSPSPAQSKSHSSTAQSPSRWRRLTQAAFIISLALVLCRALMPEAIRQPQDVLAAGQTLAQAAGQNRNALAQAPQSPGPACGIVLDLLFCLPALLVLARRALDGDFRLARSLSLIPMALLGVLAICSPLWTADKFASAVSAFHFLCALVFLWSTFQLVRSWMRLRLIAGACLGLLLALAYVGYNYHLSDVQDLRQMWDKDKAQIIANHGWAPDSYAAKMFESRVLNGQPMGFSTSTNTYAVLIVLLGVIAAGVIIQRCADAGGNWFWLLLWPFPWIALLCWRWPIERRLRVFATALVLGLASCVLLGLFYLLIYFTACRAAYATPIIAAGILLAVFFLRLITGASAQPVASPAQARILARIWHAAYFLALALMIAGTAFIVRHGLRHRTLWHESLNFRWRYWTGAYRILTSGLHRFPRQFSDFLIGIGWENFGPYYLGYRLPTATEEIRDPHNFVVRIFVELGMAGGVLLLAWLLRLWWELTRPVLPADELEVQRQREKTSGAGPRSLDRVALPNPYGQSAVFFTIAAISLLAIFINIVASVDFTADAAVIVVELFRRGVFLILLAIGPFTAGATRAPTADAGEIRLELDGRAAPWILYATLAALGTFLIHNLIEFSIFEPAPLFLFALLTGSALGIRSEARRQSRDSTTAEQPRSRKMPIVAASAAALAWLTAAVALAGPIALAESLAHDADTDALVSMRTGDRRSMLAAADDMSRAFRTVPYNADYARRAADFLHAAGGDFDTRRRALQLLDAAVAADPSSVQDLIRRAEVESEIGQTKQSLDDYRRALALDPINVRMRLDFAQALLKSARDRKRAADAWDAAYQIDRALDFNAQLPPEEIKRLSAKEVADAEAVRAAAQQLERSAIR